MKFVEYKLNNKLIIFIYYLKLLFTLSLLLSY